MTAPGELVIEPKDGQPADACVFIIHGLGADGHDFEPLVPALALPKDSRVRFIMPHAPRLPVTINGGMVMPAWYDILAMDLGRRVDEVQLKKSAERIQALIQEQIDQGIDSQRIIVAGFFARGRGCLPCRADVPCAVRRAVGHVDLLCDRRQYRPRGSQSSDSY
ncbi:hypothetical protein HORIV_50020 [Vreelandella olivaria]|uniref:Phospholipase/carboxylesterase/thioesterase domain-containing protein n=1 Tax=Vreelandella olivaria TaxID=390919 RepID=A0ABN5X074_9GAMM|nr:hypothetical protein HORIV_50020 [Halomonas olivaria]